MFVRSGWLALLCCVLLHIATYITTACSQPPKTKEYTDRPAQGFDGSERERSPDVEQHLENTRSFDAEQRLENTRNLDAGQETVVPSESSKPDAGPPDTRTPDGVSRDTSISPDQGSPPPEHNPTQDAKNQPDRPPMAACRLGGQNADKVGHAMFGRNNYIKAIPGNLPIILSAPHGGGCGAVG